MRRMLRGSAIALTLLGTVLAARPSAAQYTADSQLNIISGTTSNWSGNYIVGSNTVADILFVQTGGLLADGSGFLGYEASAHNNLAAVIGSGSIWSNAGDLYIGNSGANNFLWIAAGGHVLCDFGVIGNASGSTNNTVMVTGTGSVWNSSAFCVGCSGADNSLVISDGAQVSGGDAIVGGAASSSNSSVQVIGAGSVWSVDRLFVGVDSLGSYGGSKLVITDGGLLIVNNFAYVSWSNEFNSVVVSGTGSVLSNANTIYIGYFGADNSLVISNGGYVVSRSAVIGYDRNAASNNNVLVTDPGSVWNDNDSLVIGAGGGPATSVVISNGGRVYTTGSSQVGGPQTCGMLVTGNGSLWKNSGFVAFYGTNTFMISDGGQVVVDGALVYGRLPISGGTLSVTNAAGDGILYITGGPPPNGVLALNNGVVNVDNLQVIGFNYVTGCGTINGSVGSRGTILANCGGTLTFTGVVTNSGVMRATGGSVLEFYGPVVNTGSIDVMDGTALFHSTFINTGTLVDASYFRVVSLAVQNNDINITWTTAGGHSNVVQVATGRAGSYSNGFTDLSPVIGIPSTAGLGTTSYLDVGGATNSPARFYRVRLVP